MTALAIELAAASSPHDAAGFPLAFLAMFIAFAAFVLTCVLIIRYPLQVLGWS